MSRFNFALLAGSLACATGLMCWWLSSTPRGTDPAVPPYPANPMPPPGANGGPGWPSRDAAAAPLMKENLPAQEKARRIAKIKRDYDEIRERAAAEHLIAGADFPGGLNGFLKQLALLEREKRRDFAAVLTDEELEELERRETAAGQTVTELLHDTAATDNQRRTVFRLRRKFDDQFALAFDPAPAALLERERSRIEMQERIRDVLGHELWPSWLRGEGAEFGSFTGFVSQLGLPPSVATELWRTKNELNLRRLAILAQPNVTPEQSRAAYAEAARQIQARVQTIIGAAAFQDSSHEVLGWLPRP